MKSILKWTGIVLLIAIIAGIVAFWTPDTNRVPMRAKYGGAPSQFVDVGNGLTIHLRDEGPQNVPVIMQLHGSNSDLHAWDGWTQALSDRFRIVRFDQIGHGLTGPSPARDYRPAVMVAAVEGRCGQIWVLRNSYSRAIQWAVGSHGSMPMHIPIGSPGWS
jgi:hypothetical protein